MVIDTSALVAILFDEPDAMALARIIDRDVAPKLSMVSHVEATMVYLGRRSPGDPAAVAKLIEALNVQTVALDATQMEFVLNAFVRFGKDRHPARLNLGDCFSYGLAASLSETLLFKGDDFRKTDIVPAWNPENP